jgi:hypothetical protein
VTAADEYRAAMEEREYALGRLLAIVKNGDAPFHPNLPQTDLASRWYVRLASAVEVECEALGVQPREEVPS